MLSRLLTLAIVLQLVDNAVDPVPERAGEGQDHASVGVTAQVVEDPGQIVGEAVLAGGHEEAAGPDTTPRLFHVREAAGFTQRCRDG